MDSPVPMVTVVFRDDSALRPFKPRERGKPRDNVAAYFNALPDINYIVLAPSDDREFTYRVIFHEYTHFLVHRSTPRVPKWLDEGLAEFYSTFDGSQRDSRMLVGRPIPSHRMLLRDVGGSIPLRKFLDSKSLPDLLKDPSTTQRFYAESSAVTHYLLLGDGGAHQPQLHAFMAAMQAGELADRAFARIFGDDLETLQDGLRSHLNRATMPAIQLPSVDLKLDGPIEPLAEVDAQQIQGDLLVCHGAFDEADEHLAKALALDPAHVGSRLSRARQLVGRQDVDAALKVVTAPDFHGAAEFSTVFLKAEILRQAGRYEEALAAYQLAIKAQPDSAPAYYGLSISQLALAQPDTIASFRRCMDLRPDPNWYMARLLTTQRLALDGMGVADATNYVRQAGWQSSSSPYVMYVAALVSMRQKQLDQAHSILDEIAANVDAKSWQATIVEYLRGRLSVEAFLKKASPEELLTEAHAYIGIKAHIDGDRATALQHLQWVKEKGRHDYTEYDLALGELDRIEREK